MEYYTEKKPTIFADKWMELDYIFYTKEVKLKSKTDEVKIDFRLRWYGVIE